jgi:hypothetical protein
VLLFQKRARSITGVNILSASRACQAHIGAQCGTAPGKSTRMQEIYTPQAAKQSACKKKKPGNGRAF